MTTLVAAVTICLINGLQAVASAAAGDELYSRPGEAVVDAIHEMYDQSK